ncbi:MAG TPA: hypothetical protein VI322_03010 [Candidatus Saccharimonadia bacterium]
MLRVERRHSTRELIDGNTPVAQLLVRQPDLEMCEPARSDEHLEAQCAEAGNERRVVIDAG